jgi:hypothetical protein
MAELNARIIAKASATAAEEPLTGDLEVAELAVNTADGKLFTKHTDGSIVTISGGGGGAVDSVNTQTGVVSLGVQDMDDFGLNPGSGQSYDTFAAYNPTGDGEWFYSFSSRGILQWGANDQDGNPSNELDGVPNGGTIYVSKDNGSWTAYTLHSDGIVGDWAYLDASYPSTEFDGVSAISVSATLPADPPILPLVEGDILQWNNTKQKFKPARLGIQDMNDYELYTLPGYVFTVSGPGSLNPGTSGEWGVSSNLNSLFTWFNGDPVDALLQALAIGTTLEFETEAGYIHTTVTSSTAGANGANSSLISFAGYPWPTEIFNAQTANESIIVRVAPVPTTPLAEGDVLRWNDTDQKFKPQPISLDLVNLNDVNELYSSGPTWSTQVAPNDVDTQGEYSTGSNTSIRVADLSDDGTDWSAILLALTNGDSFDVTYANKNNGNALKTITCNVTSISNLGSSVTITCPEAVTLWQEDADLGVTFSGVLFSTVVDPDDGQVLTWIDSKGAWEAADPSAASAPLIRAALGIGEYPDDAAAGIGGVASGAMYYNITSSDYRLKS